MSIEEDIIKRIIKVLVYIDQRLDEEISLEELARKACYSPYHFHRVFFAIVGETVHKYVRRLKLERAAGKLRYTSLPVTEIALDANYETPSAFAKAFKQSMGTSPERYRFDNALKKLKEYPMIHPDAIQKIDDLELLFIRSVGDYSKSPSEAWIKLHKFIEENSLDSKKLRYFGISHDDPNITPEGKLRYDAAILAPGVKERGEVGREILQGGKYAVFTHKGPYSTLEESFNRIFLKWLPASKETFDETRRCFTEYFHLEFVKTNPEKLVTKIFIPLL